MTITEQTCQHCGFVSRRLNADCGACRKRAVQGKQPRARWEAWMSETWKLRPPTFDLLDKLYVGGTVDTVELRPEGHACTSSVCRMLRRLRSLGLVETREAEAFSCVEVGNDGRGRRRRVPNAALHSLTPAGVCFVETVYDLMVADMEDADHGSQEEVA